MKVWTIVSAALLATSAASAAPALEHLVMQPYPGPPAWKIITDKSSPDGFYHEHIPANQTVGNFSDILSDSGFYRLRGDDPAAYLKTVFSGFPNACSGVRVAGPQVMKEGGYEVAYGQVYCGQQNGEPYGVMDFYKVISGQKALYVISREFHTPASSNGALLTFPPGHEADAKALLTAQRIGDQYLANQVYVCGGASTDARCQ